MRGTARGTLLQVAAGVAGLVSVLGGVGGLAWWSTRGVEVDAAEWRPRCAARMGWDQVEVTARTREPSGETVLFGLDRSGSNAELAQIQLRAALEAAGALPVETGVSVLLIGERSDDSTVPDFPLELGSPVTEAEVEGLSCWPDCPTDSLFAQRCAEQLGDALELRAAELHASLASERDAAAASRRARLARWRPQAEAWAPGRGTSLLRFFHKVADLPVVRDPRGRVTLVVLSDLEESRSGERRRVEAMAHAIERDGRCPTQGLPRLEGVEVLLVQSLTAGVDGEAWADRWDALLGCTGARVARHRFGAAVPLNTLLADHLEAREPIAQRDAG